MFLCVRTHGICVCRCVPVYKDQKIVLGNMDLISLAWNLISRLD